MTESRSNRLKRIVSEIKDSINGVEYDYTEGKISKAVLLLSIPMVLEMVMESVFAVVDIFFVSRLGADAVATVGITESILTLVYAVSMGLGMAITAIVSRRIGEKDKIRASEAALQAILLGIIVSVPFTIAGIFYSKEILILMGANSVIVNSMNSYTSILIGSNLIIMLLFIINAIFRGAGDAAISMRVLWVANLINLVLDPCLIFGYGPFPEMGIAGAAVATSIGRGVAVVYQIFILFSNNGKIRIYLKKLVLDFVIIKNIIKLSLGGIGQYLIATSSWIVLMRYMATFGSEALAGYTIAIRVLIFTLLPSWGMSNAASTLVGQNLGANKPERAEKAVWITGFYNLFFLLLISILFISNPEMLIKLFSSEANVIKAGGECLQIVSYGYVFYAFGMVMAQAFNGAGDTNTPMALNFICFWMIEIPIAYFLAFPAGLNEHGVFFAITISESVLGVLGIIIFKQGKWKLRKV